MNYYARLRALERRIRTRAACVQWAALSAAASFEPSGEPPELPTGHPAQRMLDAFMLMDVLTSPGVPDTDKEEVTNERDRA